MNEVVPDDLGKMTPHQWFDLKRREILAELGIRIDAVVAATPDAIQSALGRAGRLIRERYGEDQFQNELGHKIRQDLINALNGGALTILDTGLAVVAYGNAGGRTMTVQVGFTGEPMQVGIIDLGFSGKNRFLLDMGLNLLPGEF